MDFKMYICYMKIKKEFRKSRDKFFLVGYLGSFFVFE